MYRVLGGLKRRFKPRRLVWRRTTRLVAAVRPGQTIRAGILRDGRRLTLNIRAGVRPSEAELRAGVLGGGSVDPGDTPAPAGQSVEGISVAPLTAGTRSRYRLPEGSAGVVITGVERGSAAARLGLRPGMLITRADRSPVSSASELRAAIAAVKAAGRPGVLIFVVEAGGATAVPLVLEFGADD